MKIAIDLPPQRRPEEAQKEAGRAREEDQPAGYGAGRGGRPGVQPGYRGQGIADKEFIVPVGPSGCGKSTTLRMVAGLSMSVGGCTVELSQEKQRNLAARGAAAQDITLGVRPSHMVLAKQAGNTLSAAVEVSEMMGSEVHFHANANGKDVVVIVPTMDAEGERIDSFHAGDRLNLTFSGNVCHIFGRDGGNLEF